MYEFAAWPAVVAVWGFLVENGMGLIVLTLAGTGGCWAGIHLADRVNQQFLDKHGVYPIEYARTRIWGNRRK
ncbi:hypothetical protein [Pseudonocardia sp. TRM90224]|uniref:hypothetical protein n=1 Tax=Pseudonocardia sp. TRM90224 TaxID=2812678 RepID=UPI001E4F6E3B|nr:hypothetical protein [Pseudonocardia sp. TRM90224]